MPSKKIIFVSYVGQLSINLFTLNFRQEKRNQTTDYEWVVILRNIPNMYSCKYCRVRISNNYSKKSHAASKIHQINENLYLGNRYYLPIASLVNI